jgi:Arc/MetJ-type ribon-helix-helix transcriptional regulator
MRDALRVWKRDRSAAVRRLRELWEEGLASGEPVEMPEDWAGDIIRRGRERLAAEREAE